MPFKNLFLRTRIRALSHWGKAAKKGVETCWNIVVVKNDGVNDELPIILSSAWKVYISLTFCCTHCGTSTPEIIRRQSMLSSLWARSVIAMEEHRCRVLQELVSISISQLHRDDMVLKWSWYGKMLVCFVLFYDQTGGILAWWHLILSLFLDRHGPRWQEMIDEARTSLERAEESRCKPGQDSVKAVWMIMKLYVMFYENHDVIMKLCGNLWIYGNLCGKSIHRIKVAKAKSCRKNSVRL
jgi:hypothetical protein